MADNEKDEVTTVNTDFQSSDSPFNSGGYVGVDPQFQRDPIEKSEKTTTAARKGADADEEGGKRGTATGDSKVASPGVTAPSRK